MADAEQATGVGSSGARASLVRWVQPTRGYVAAAVVTAVAAAGAGVVWQVRALESSSGSGSGSAGGGGGFPVASLVVFVLGAVVLVETARRPKPWAPGLQRRGSDLRPRDRAERRVVRRAKWCGVLPAQLRLQRVAALWVVRPMSNSVVLGVFMFVGAVQLGMAGRGVFGPGWEGALPGMVWTLGAAGLLVVVAWLRAQARKLNRAFETTHALRSAQNPTTNGGPQERVE